MWNACQHLRSVKSVQSNLLKWNCHDCPNWYSAAVPSILNLSLQCRLQAEENSTPSSASICSLWALLGVALVWLQCSFGSAFPIGWRYKFPRRWSKELCWPSPALPHSSMFFTQSEVPRIKVRLPKYLNAFRWDGMFAKSVGNKHFVTHQRQMLFTKALAVQCPAPHT